MDYNILFSTTWIITFYLFSFRKEKLFLSSMKFSKQDVWFKLCTFCIISLWYYNFRYPFLNFAFLFLSITIVSWVIVKKPAPRSVKSFQSQRKWISLRCWIVQKNCVEFEKRILVFFFMKSLMEFAFDSRLINIIWSIVLFEENIFIFHTLKLHMLKNVKESDQDKISKNTRMLVFF